MKLSLELPDGELEIDDTRWGNYEDSPQGDFGDPRLVFAAAHVVMLPSYAAVPHSVETPGSPSEILEFIDWEATMNQRRRIAGWGMGIAESMDTAQRFSIGWPAAKRLIEQTGALKLPTGFCAGASCDQLQGVLTTGQIVDGILEQIELIHRVGGVAVILPIARLCELRLGEAEYVEVYRSIIRNTQTGPLFVHWLGEMFLPSLRGYFPGESFQRIMEIDPGKVRGAKLSLLDSEKEIQLRREFVERDQIMLTGDDFHFGSLIAGSSGKNVEVVRKTQLLGTEIAIGDFSHALLGVLDGIARPASIALGQLRQGNLSAYDEIMLPCEKLGQHVFQTPTGSYKAGLAFLAWLNGWQSNRMLVNHEEKGRSHAHYCELVRLASKAGVIENANFAAFQMAQYLDDRCS